MLYFVKDSDAFKTKTKSRYKYLRDASLFVFMYVVFRIIFLAKLSSDFT